MKANEHVIFSLVLGLLFVAGGTIYYSAEEGWSQVDSLYFTTMTLTTVGYGDLVPTTDASKIFTSIYSIFGIGVMLYLLGSVVSTFLFNQERYVERLFSKFNRKQEQINEDKKELEKLETKKRKTKKRKKKRKKR